MKFIGFIKEHNPIKEAITLQSIKDSNTINGDRLSLKVVDYLNSGELLLAWMGYFIDFENNKPIAPDSYFTDGEWIWPAYFVYYLNKYPRYPIEKSFIDHLHSKNFKMDSTISPRDKSILEKKVSLKLNENYNN
jgi:hypothetical protein